MVDELSLYLAAIYLGAVSPDHRVVSLSWSEYAALSRADLRKLHHLRH